MISERTVTIQKTGSMLFTLRVWEEAVGDGRYEIRGTLKHILSGETHHFRDWQTLAGHIEGYCIMEREKTAGGKT